MNEILERASIQLPSGWRILLWVLVGLGALMFIVGLATGSAQRTWEAFLINTVFWGGMAFAGVILSAIWQMTDARWGQAYKRLAEAYSGFLPVAFLAFIAVFFGAHHLFEWVEAPMHAKEGYLNLPFFIVRNTVGLAVLVWAMLAYVRNALKPDMALANRLMPGYGGSFAQRLLKNFGNFESDTAQLQARARQLAPVMTLVYTLVFSMVAIDYVMSLDQVFFSTLFPVYVIVGNLYSALALMLIIVTFLRRRPELAGYMTLNRYNDLAKLTFAIAMLYAYMVFSQYLVIWYSNLPEEAPYLVLRSIAPTPWKPLFWTLVVVLFLLPFVTLISRALCRKPPIVAAIALVLLIGQWWAHYLLVVPSIQERAAHGGEPHFYFGLHEILLTAGFAGAFFLSLFWFMGRVPALTIADYRLTKAWHGH